MRNILIILLILGPMRLLAQFAGPQVVASSGGFHQGTSVSLSYTIGELAVNTLTAGSYTMTQGFQQPGGEVTAVQLGESKEWIFKTWPNPVSDILYLQADDRVRSDLVLETYDLLGRIQKQVKLEIPIRKDPYQIDMSGMKSGLYIIKIRSEDQQITEVFRIRKE